MCITMYLVRRGETLTPASPADAEGFDDLPRNRIIKVTVQIEPPKQLVRLYWALLAKLVKAGVNWPSTEAADKDLLITLGYRSAVILRSDGATHTVRFEPLSKKGWDAPQWRNYFQQVYDHILREVLPGQSSPALRYEIETFCGVKFKEAMGDGIDNLPDEGNEVSDSAGRWNVG